MYIRLREALPEGGPWTPVPLGPQSSSASQKPLLLRLAEYLCHSVSSIYLLVSSLILSVQFLIGKMSQ